MTAPTTTELIDRFGEPDDIAFDSTDNRTKAGWAFKALQAYAPLVTDGYTLPVPVVGDNWEHTEAETLISDLMSDLLHLATITGCDPEVALHRTTRDFHAEVGRGYDQ